MALRDLVNQELIQLTQSGSVPATLSATDSSGIVITLEVTAIDSMSVELMELSLFVPQLQNAAFDVLKQWSIDLSQRITYLLENIGPLEFDPNAGQVLIRSSPPGQLPHGTQFYEIMLSSSGNGTFTLRRYKSIQGTPGRDQVEMQMTIEVLLRLIDDLVDTIP
ncbi:hypothetical protein [Thalassoglobus sp.]|uniref:hypothetical protein n=1 Tax=Thalassoglobus sp. TaxID=2795869 RepID=UPI003AA7AE76